MREIHYVFDICSIHVFGACMALVTQSEGSLAGREHRMHAPPGLRPSILSRASFGGASEHRRFGCVVRSLCSIRTHRHTHTHCIACGIVVRCEWWPCPQLLLPSVAKAQWARLSMECAVEASCRRLAQASLVLDKSDREEAAKLAEVLKDFMRSQVRNLVQRPNGRPLLCSYSSDGTPLLTKQRFRAKLVGKQKPIVRVGGQCHEYLIQQAFVRFLDAEGMPHIVAQLRDPAPLASGKSAWHVFTAGREFIPSLREMSHGGIAIQHMAFDRALHKPLVRRFPQ